MSMEFVNRVCPNCNDPNFMISLGDFSKEYKYKCMNCNRYFNDIDFEKKPLQPVWKSKCINTKVDMVEVVRCKDCKYRPTYPKAYGAEIEGNWCYWCERLRVWKRDDWFCADGRRKEVDE